MVEGRCDWWNRKKRRKEDPLALLSEIESRQNCLINRLIPSIQTSPAIASSESFIQNYEMFHQTEETIWSAQFSFLHRQRLLPMMLETPVEHQVGLLNSAAGTDHEAKTVTCAPTHFKSAAVCHAPSESKHAWQRLYHLSMEVNSHCVSAESWK